MLALATVLLSSARHIHTVNDILSKTLQAWRRASTVRCLDLAPLPRLSVQPVVQGTPEPPGTTYLPASPEQLDCASYKSPGRRVPHSRAQGFCPVAGVSKPGAGASVGRRGNGASHPYARAQTLQSGSGEKHVRTVPGSSFSKPRTGYGRALLNWK